MDIVSSSIEDKTTQRSGTVRAWGHFLMSDGALVRLQIHGSTDLEVTNRFNALKPVVEQKSQDDYEENLINGAIVDHTHVSSDLLARRHIKIAMQSNTLDAYVLLTESMDVYLAGVSDADVVSRLGIAQPKLDKVRTRLAALKAGTWSSKIGEYQALVVSDTERLDIDG